MLSSPSPSPNQQAPSWDPLLITMVCSICIIFLVISSKCWEHFCSIRANTLSRNRRQLLNVNNPDEPSMQFQTQGLDSYITRTLPVRQFKKDREEWKQSNTDCRVCLGDFEDGEWLKNLPNCSHVFHVACIDAWFQTHSSCPLCRSSVFNIEYSVSVYDLRENLSREELQEEQTACSSLPNPSKWRYSSSLKPGKCELTNVIQWKGHKSSSKGSTRVKLQRKLTLDYLLELYILRISCKVGNTCKFFFKITTRSNSANNH